MKLIKIQLYITLCVLGLICIFPKGLMAQEHMFTKSISKTINLTKQKIVIDAEKANIKIVESKNQKLIIDIKFISKHTNKLIAQKQLEYFKHVLNIKSREIYMRNYILINAGEELTGTISAEYVLKIPQNRNITITNSLGDIIISNIQGNFNINFKYGKLNMQNIKGELNLDAQIGEVLIKNSELTCIIESNYLSSYFYSCGGAYSIVSNLGSINFTITKALLKLDIEASGTEITLLNRDCEEYNISLISKSGSIFLDDCTIKNKSFISIDSRNLTKDKNEFLYINPDIKKSITVKNKFANIALQ